MDSKEAGKQVEEKKPQDFHSGFVAIIGRPSVGKSTLVNTLLGEKVAIVSPKPQTTRHRIVGIIQRKDAQIMLLDTPGLHKPTHVLGRQMVEISKAAMDDADVVIVMIDGRVGVTEEDQRVFDRIKTAQRHRPRPVILAINKCDIANKPKILPIIERCAKLNLFSDIIPISALTRDQLDVLMKAVTPHLPAGPQWYEPHQKTDQSREQLVAEFIREQVLLATHEEVPHAVAVMIDFIEEREKVTTIHATILVERPGQKAIVIGAGGSMLKQIGQEARKELERLLGRKVFLELWVKVSEGWRSDERMIKELGYTGPTQGA